MLVRVTKITSSRADDGFISTLVTTSSLITVSATLSLFPHFVVTATHTSPLLVMQLKHMN
jgi:hypothetical protein